MLQKQNILVDIQKGNKKRNFWLITILLVFGMILVVTSNHNKIKLSFHWSSSRRIKTKRQISSNFWPIIKVYVEAKISTLGVKRNFLTFSSVWRHTAIHNDYIVNGRKTLYYPLTVLDLHSMLGCIKRIHSNTP